MKNASIYEFNSYKKALAHLLLAKGNRGRLSRAAEMLNCQPSFLSRVIRAEVHLTPDQAFMICRFMKWASDESEYFQTLVAYERAVEPQYKTSLTARITSLKKEHESLQKRTQKDNFPLAEQEATYFSSWHWSALHFLASIPEFQTVKALSHRLCLPEGLTLNYLKRLQQYGLVRETKQGWEYAGGQFHRPRNSPFVVLHHQNWRSRAVLDAQNFNNESIHYTSVHTLSSADVARLREMLLEFISQSNALAQPSQPEESVVLTVDLFKT